MPGLKKTLVYDCLENYSLTGFAHNTRRARRRGRARALSREDQTYIRSLLSHRHSFFLDELQEMLSRWNRAPFSCSLIEVLRELITFTMVASLQRSGEPPRHFSVRNFLRVRNTLALYKRSAHTLKLLLPVVLSTSLDALLVPSRCWVLKTDCIARLNPDIHCHKIG